MLSADRSTPPAAGRRRGPLLWLVAALVAAALAGAVVLVVVLNHPRPVSLDVTSPTAAGPEQLVVGHCLKTVPSAEQVGSVLVVPCSTGHRGQVVGQTTLTDASVATADGDDGRPDGHTLAHEAQDACSHVALQDVPPDARYVAWIPTEQSWASGDRRALCILEASTLVGSVLG